MKKILKVFMLPFVLCTVFVNIHAQSNYYKLVLDHSQLQKYDSDSHFKRFIFYFKELSANHFILQGAAFKANGNIMGSVFSLTTFIPEKIVALNNVFNGIYEITKTQLNGVNVSKDLYLTPFAYSNDPAVSAFVSYLVSDDPTENQLQKRNGKKSSRPFFTSFSINPSPPR